MKWLLAVLAALALQAVPAHAQRLRWGFLNVGVVSERGTANHHVAITLGATCGLTHTGLCPSVEFGGDFTNPTGDLFGLNVGFAAAFGPRRHTSLVPRVGLSLLIQDDAHPCCFVGSTAGLRLRQGITSTWALSVDYVWRHYSRFDWPILSVGMDIQLKGRQE
jgi:hypothetical protein